MHLCDSWWWGWRLWYETYGHSYGEQGWRKTQGWKWYLLDPYSFLWNSADFNTVSRSTPNPSPTNLHPATNFFKQFSLMFKQVDILFLHNFLSLVYAWALLLSLWEGRGVGDIGCPFRKKRKVLNSYLISLQEFSQLQRGGVAYLRSPSLLTAMGGMGGSAINPHFPSFAGLRLIESYYTYGDSEFQGKETDENRPREKHIGEIWGCNKCRIFIVLSSGSQDALLSGIDVWQYAQIIADQGSSLKPWC